MKGGKAMHNTSAQYKLDIKKPSRSFECKITIGDKIFYNEDIVDVIIDGNIQPQEGFMIGSTTSQTLDLTLLNKGDTIYSTNQVKVEIGLKTGNTIEYVLMGIFNIDDIEKTDYTTKFTCYDNMIKFETAYFSSLGDTSTLQQVVNELSSKTGVQFVGSLPAYNVKKLEGFTCREILSYVASVCGGNAVITRDGKFTIVYQKDINYFITADNYFDYKREEVKYKIGKVTCQVKEKETISKGSLGTDSMELLFENPWVTDSILQDIHNRLNGFEYLGYSMKWQGDLSLDVGDIITCTDVKGVVRKLPILSQKLTYTGGLTSEIAAKGESKNKNSFSSSGSTTNKVNRVVTDLALVNRAFIDYAHINDADIVNLKAQTAKIQNAEIEIANINNLIAGNISAGSTQTIHLTSANAVLDETLIKSGIAAKMSIGDLLAGNIDTNRFNVVGSNGNLTIKDNTIQIKDSARIRIQIGKDASEDYSMYVWDKQGNLMFDALGIKSSAIKDKIIRDDMISDNANINGAKINISSLITEINKDTNTNTLKSSKVLLDGTTQTLNVAFNSLNSTVNGVKSTTETNTTTLNVQQGKIDTLIKDTTIEENGTTAKLKDSYSVLKQTVNGINTTVASHSTSIGTLGTNVNNAQTTANNANTLADSKAKVFTATPTTPYKVGDIWTSGPSGDIMKCKVARVSGAYVAADWEKASKYTDDTKANAVEGKVTTVESKQVSLEQSLNGFKTTVSSTYSTKSELSTVDGKVTNLTTRIANAEQKITDSAIISTVSKTFISKADAEITYSTKASMTLTENQLRLDFSGVTGKNNFKTSSGDSYPNGKCELEHHDWGYSAYMGNGKAYRWQVTGNACRARFSKCITKNGVYSVSFFAKSLGGNYPTLTIDLCDKGHHKAYRVTKEWVLCKYENITISNYTKEVYNFLDINCNYTASLPWDMLISNIMINEGPQCLPWSENGSELIAGSTQIDASGVTIYNGALTVKNKTNQDVLTANAAGNLSMVGMITTFNDSRTKRQIELIKNDINFYDWETAENNLSIGRIYTGKQVVNGLTISTPSLTIKNTPVSYISICSDRSMLMHFDDYNRSTYSGHIPIWFYKNAIMGNGASMYFNMPVSTGQIFGGSDSKLVLQAPQGAGQGIQVQSNSGSVWANIVAGNNYPGLIRVDTYIDGNLAVSGSKNSIQKTKNYGERLINAYETAEYYYGDIGSGKIVNGECVISIDEILLECVNTSHQYHVFTQVYSGSINKIERFKDYFVVHGEEDTQFSWELKAKRLGYENHRLETPNDFDKTENYENMFNRHFEEFEAEKTAEKQSVEGDMYTNDTVAGDMLAHELDFKLDDFLLNKEEI